MHARLLDTHLLLPKVRMQPQSSARLPRAWRAQLALGCRLLVDGMGSFSPIAAQARQGRKPDSVVMLVGSCATGLPPCTGADLLYSFTPIDRCLPDSRSFLRSELGGRQGAINPMSPSHLAVLVPWLEHALEHVHSHQVSGLTAAHLVALHPVY